MGLRGALARRACAFSLGTFVVAFSAPASAAGSFTVPAASGAQSVGNNDTGSIAAANTLSAATTITWTGGSASPGVIITNDGTISATTRGIDTSGAFTTGSFTLNNDATGTLISSTNDGFRINTNITAGTIAVNNSGKLVSGALNGSGNIVAAASGQALDFAAIVSSTANIQITNAAGALLGASGDDAIRPGSGTIIITNSGLIDATQSAARAINLNSAGTLASVISFTLSNNAGATVQS